MIITNKKGSAGYIEDLPIPNEFKFDDEEEKIDKIIDKINYCIKNYDKESYKFEEYRKFIKNEKKNFEFDVVRIFNKKY